MQEFEKGWPEGFWSTISKKVKTVPDSKKHIKVGSQKVYDTSVIYSRVISIQASSMDIDIKKVLSHNNNNKYKTYIAHIQYKHFHMRKTDDKIK